MRPGQRKEGPGAGSGAPPSPPGAADQTRLGAAHARAAPRRRVTEEQILAWLMEADPDDY